MAELPPFTHDPRDPGAIVRMARFAEGQDGVISWPELLACGIGRMRISRLVAAGHLHRIHPGVYAVGHRVLGVRGRLIAGLRYTGADAALSHQTGAWWWQWIETIPARIHVGTARKRRSLKEVRVHAERTVPTVTHKGLPVTSPAQTLLDLASVASTATLRRAVAEADHQGLLELTEIEDCVGRGRPGSGALRDALDAHLPELVQTASVLEERFLTLIQARGLPIPEVNALVEGLRVDCLWRRSMVVVELDGHRWHSNPAGIERDRDRDLILRRAGYTVLRYTWQQVLHQPDAIVDELRELLIAELSRSAHSPSE